MLALKSLFHRLPFTINWLKSREMEKLASEWSRKYSFDLVHFDVISLAPFLTYFEQIPRVLDHHNIESHMMLRRVRNESNLLKKFYFLQEGLKLQSYEKRLCPKFNLHITCSDLDKIRLTDFVPDLNVHEVPNGVDVDYFSPQDEPSVDESMIFVGNLAWYPNTEAMLFFAREIWPAIKREIPGAVMHVVGAKTPKFLVDFSQDIADFHVHGFVPDVRPYISQAAVYVCPIRDGGGTKLKILDALAMGKAIVADPIACEGIEVEDNQSVLFAERPEEYVAQIKRVFSDIQLRTSLERNARELAVSNYSYSQIGRLLSDLYCECCVASP
jgi:glycosyltransferase involved in cell wall biosynthesis